MSGSVILSKAANCLIEDAEVNPGVERAMDSAGVQPEPLKLVLAGFKAAYGGLWVGGRITLTSSDLTFTPNKVNRAVHEELSNITVDLRHISGVDVQSGLVTKIIAVELPDHVLKVRCFDARGVAQHIREAAASARS